VRLSDHIRLDISHETLNVGDQQVTLTVSIGVAEIDAAARFDQHLIAADRALYAAKRDGRNCVRLAP
jgi:diguanylate cyclase (GGDEF)-like protein